MWPAPAWAQHHHAEFAVHGRARSQRRALHGFGQTHSDTICCYSFGRVSSLPQRASVLHLFIPLSSRPLAATYPFNTSCAFPECHVNAIIWHVAFKLRFTPVSPCPACQVGLRSMCPRTHLVFWLQPFSLGQSSVSWSAFLLSHPFTSFQGGVRPISAWSLSSFSSTLSSRLCSGSPRRAEGVCTPASPQTWAVP